MSGEVSFSKLKIKQNELEKRNLIKTLFFIVKVQVKSNHRLPVETGHWDKTPLEDRKCILCSKHDIGDEFHYLFVCDHFISFCLFDLILYVHSTIFQLCGTVLPGFNQY